jgi:hypothetical protein
MNKKPISKANTVVNTVEPVVSKVEPVVKNKKIVKDTIEPDVKHTVEPVVKPNKVAKHTVKPIIKPKKVVKDAVVPEVNKVVPIIKHTVEQVVKHDDEEAKQIEKLNEQFISTKSVEIFEDKNNKILCDQIKNMNISHTKKLKKCTYNFNIFDY